MAQIKELTLDDWFKLALDDPADCEEDDPDGDSIEDASEIFSQDMDSSLSVGQSKVFSRTNSRIVYSYLNTADSYDSYPRSIYEELNFQFEDDFEFALDYAEKYHGRHPASRAPVRRLRRKTISFRVQKKLMPSEDRDRVCRRDPYLFFFRRRTPLPPPTMHASSDPVASYSSSSSRAPRVKRTLGQVQIDRYEADLRRAMQLSQQQTHESGLTLQQIMELSQRDLTPEDYDLLLRLDTTVAPKTVKSSVLSKLDTLTEVASSEKESREPDSVDCMICLSEFAAGEKLQSLPCGHKYHYDCIMPWLSERATACPLCKTEINEDTVRNSNINSNFKSQQKLEEPKFVNLESEFLSMFDMFDDNTNSSEAKHEHPRNYFDDEDIMDAVSLDGVFELFV